MSHEHGGGEASIRREAAEALADEIEKAERRFRSAMGRQAITPYIAPPFGNMPYSRDRFAPSNQQRERTREEETDNNTTKEES